MRIAILTSLTVISLGSLAIPSWADPDVDANPRSDGVILRDHEVKTPSRSVPFSPALTSHEPALKTHCFFDGSEPDFRCALQDFPEGTPSDAELSPGDVLTAAREVGMPALELHIQPDGQTLVNVDTIFYTVPTTLRRTVTLLGHSVRLEGTPVRYTWVHGDGTTASTGQPGRPYPAKDVTHRYQQPGSDLRARVDTTYSVRYSVDGGSWADLAETLTATGPSSALDVDEAVPVLTH